MFTSTSGTEVGGLLEREKIAIRVCVCVIIEQDVPVDINIRGSQYDTETGVYSLLPNDDTDSCPVGTIASRLVFIIVDGLSSEKFGGFTLNINALLSPLLRSPPIPRLPLAF